MIGVSSDYIGIQFSGFNEEIGSFEVLPCVLSPASGVSQRVLSIVIAQLFICQLREKSDVRFASEKSSIPRTEFEAGDKENRLSISELRLTRGTCLTQPDIARRRGNGFFAFTVSVSPVNPDCCNVSYEKGVVLAYFTKIWYN